MPGPLSGVRVLDLSRILAGPWATQVMADFGAEVIKVEHPERGDDTRSWGPPYLKDKNNKDTNDAAYYFAANRGKKSLAIDISTEEGQSIIRRLVMQCDVFVENFKVDGLKKYSLDYDALKHVNPKIIYCSITGFGQTGPYAKRAGYDAIIQGMGGLMSITGERDDLPGGGPQKVGVAVADLMTGMYAVSAINAALYHRKKTGEGQFIDLALLDTQVAWLANQNMNYLMGGQIPQRQGSAHPNIVPYQAIAAKDGHFMLAVGNDEQFRRLCVLLNLDELAYDERYKKNESRVNNREILIQLITKKTITRTCQEWLGILSEQGIPAAPINNIKQVFEDKQVKYREMLFSLPHYSGIEVPQVANPVNFSKSPIEYSSAAPVLSEHSRELLSEFGYSQQEIEELENCSIVGRKR